MPWPSATTSNRGRVLVACTRRVTLLVGGCDRQTAASSLVGRVPCYPAPACPAPTRNSWASDNTTDLRGGRSWAVGLWWWSAGPDRPGGRHQDDRLVGWSGRLRPAAMGGALDAEVAHLALDDPRVGAQPTLGDQVPQKLSYRGRDGPGQPPRGKSPPAA